MNSTKKKTTLEAFAVNGWKHLRQHGEECACVPFTYFSLALWKMGEDYVFNLGLIGFTFRLVLGLNVVDGSERDLDQRKRQEHYESEKV